MTDEKKRDDYEMNEKSQNFEPAPASRTPPSAPSSSIVNSPSAPIMAYCFASILMTVSNKYVLSGRDFNLNFFLLIVQVRRRKLAEFRTRKCG
jgi:GDP-mannose transporter